MNVAANAFIDAGKEMGKNLKKRAGPKASLVRSKLMKSGR
jgi:hypothetical protein